MSRLNNLEFAETDSMLAEEDSAELAAIDEGVKAANGGRVVPEEVVRKLIPQCVSKFSTRTQR